MMTISISGVITRFDEKIIFEGKHVQYLQLVNQMECISLH